MAILVTVWGTIAFPGETRFDSWRQESDPTTMDYAMTIEYHDIHSRVASY